MSELAEDWRWRFVPTQLLRPDFSKCRSGLKSSVLTIAPKEFFSFFKAFVNYCLESRPRWLELMMFDG